MKLISINVPDAYLKVLELMVTDGKFPNRSEAIRVAIRDLIKTEFLLDDAMKQNSNSFIEVESEEIPENPIF